MTVETIAKALKGHKTGNGWVACCPAHDDRVPSLAISEARDGRVLLCCHAGCAQNQVIDALRSLGLWGKNGRQNYRRRSFNSNRQNNSRPERSDADKTDYALRIWQATIPSTGTLVETYLHSRSLRMPVPDTLRFHPRLKHPAGEFWPAMVALVSRGPDDTAIAIHRTFLARDGLAKAPVEPQKMMLGPCRGGVVRLPMPGGLLMVGEGIETCLAATQATGHPAWAALSTSGLRALDLPASARDVIILADGDDPGEAAARVCASRWKREGRRVRIARPPRGLDFNDMLAGGAL